MNERIKKKINEIINKHGKRPVGTCMNSYCKIDKEMNDYINSDATFGDSFSQRLFNIYYGILEWQKCSYENCSNKVKFLNFVDGYRNTCSKWCTNYVKYGCKSTFGTKEQHEKANKTKIEKYGGVGAGSKETKKKMEATMIERYGTIYQKLPEYVKKCKQTSIERYGEEHFLKTNEGKKKLHDSVVEKYGCHFMSLQEYKEVAKNNFKKLNLSEKTGIGQKQTYFNRLIEYCEANGFIPMFSKDDYLGIRNYREDEFFKYKFKCKTCDYEFKTSISNIRRDGLNCPKCNKKVKSMIQHNLFLSIKDKYKDLSFIEDESRVLNNHQQIDIYCEQLRFGIEYNGNCWHSQKFNSKGKNYHFNKFLNFKKNNVNVLSFWSDEFNNKKERIYEMIDLCIKNDLKLIDDVSLISCSNEVCIDVKNRMFSNVLKDEKLVLIKYQDKDIFVLKYIEDNNKIIINDMLELSDYKLNEDIFKHIFKKKIYFQLDNRILYFYEILTSGCMKFERYIEQKFYILKKGRSNILNETNEEEALETGDIIWNYGESFFSID